MGKRRQSDDLSRKNRLNNESLLTDAVNAVLMGICTKVKAAKLQVTRHSAFNITTSWEARGKR